MTHLFYLVEVVVTWGVGVSDLGNSSDIDRLAPTSSTDWSSASRASYLLCRGVCGGCGGQGKGSLAALIVDLFPLVVPL